MFCIVVCALGIASGPKTREPETTLSMEQEPARKKNCESNPSGESSCVSECGTNEYLSQDGTRCVTSCKDSDNGALSPLTGRQCITEETCTGN